MSDKQEKPAPKKKGFWSKVGDVIGALLTAYIENRR